MIPEAVLSVAPKTISSLVDKLVIPRVESFCKKCSLLYKEVLIPRGEHFKEYLNRTYEKNSIINTLVFHNSQRLLKDVYVTQSLISFSSLYEVISGKNKVKIDKLPVDLIKQYKKILITDTAGMGKSTIMKYMFLDLIDRGIEQVGIPIYLELNRLNKEHAIIEEIKEELSSLSEEFNNDLLLRFIQDGGFIFFLDGYDEVSGPNRAVVTRDIQSFISKAGTKNYYILTSRPEGHLPSFGDFKSFSIQPLTKQEAFELLEKYDMTTDKVMSANLIKLLKTGKYASISEYLENPLLVSLLFLAYKYEQEIPLKKHEFYRQVFVALYKEHKLTQGIEPHEKSSGLAMDDFNKVLKCVGYICLRRIGVTFDEETILKAIGNAKAFCGNLQFQSSDFLNDLLLAVPLFCKDGSEYKWVHKSLMEYYAARFLADETFKKQDAYLKEIYNDNDLSKYANMLDLYYDIDFEGFSKNIMIPFFNEYMKYHDAHYYLDSHLGEELIEARIGFLFGFNKVGAIRDRYVRSEDQSQIGVDSISETDELSTILAKSMINSMTKPNTESLDSKLETLSKSVDITVSSYTHHLSNAHNIWSLYEKKSLGKSVSDFVNTPSNKFATGFYQGLTVLALYSLEKYHIIQKLILDKRPDLFHQYKNESLVVDQTLFNDDRVFVIDFMTGKSNRGLFEIINNLLARIFYFDIRFNMNILGKFYYLNYEAVKTEVNKFKNRTKPGDKSVLFSGM